MAFRWDRLDTSLIIEFLIQSLGGAFVGLFDRITYGNTTISDFGDHWKVGIIFLILTMVLSVLVRVYGGQKMTTAIVFTLLLVIIYGLASVMFNSLWRYGVVFYKPYFNVSVFFGSDVLVGLVVAMGTVMFLNLIPSEKKQKRKKTHDLESCIQICLKK